MFLVDLQAQVFSLMWGFSAAGYWWRCQKDVSFLCDLLPEKNYELLMLMYKTEVNNLNDRRGF